MEERPAYLPNSPESLAFARSIAKDIRKKPAGSEAKKWSKFNVNPRKANLDKHHERVRNEQVSTSDEDVDSE